MGSRRYWTVVGVVAVLVGLIVFALTATSAGDAEPSATNTSDVVPTTVVVSTTVAVETSVAVTTTVAVPTTPPLSTLPSVIGDGLDWLYDYDPTPSVLSGQVVDLDDDGTPDVALFGSAESPLIYTIDDAGEPAERLSTAGDLPAEQGQLEQLSRQVAELEAVTEGLQDQLADSPPPTTIVSQTESSQSSGLTSTQESLLLALISTAGVVLVGIGAPVMSAWARRRFGASAD